MNPLTRSVELENHEDVCDDWVEHERNVFGPSYNLAERNKGLRLRLISDGYLSLVNAVLRPPRCIYSSRDLGPSRYRVASRTLLRTDFRVNVPGRGVVECSEWRPDERLRGKTSSNGGASQPNSNIDELDGEDDPLPVVIYVHGNSGCRLDVLANGLLQSAAESGFAVVAFDCCGSGLSSGDVVTLGFQEKLDLAAVVEHVSADSSSTSSPPLAPEEGNSSGGSGSGGSGSGSMGNGSSKSTEGNSGLRGDQGGGGGGGGDDGERRGDEPWNGGQDEGEGGASVGASSTLATALPPPMKNKKRRRRRVCLWGFSMGAAACMLYAHESRAELIHAMVLDSSFTSFRDLVFTHPQAAAVRFGRAALRVVFPLYRRSVYRRSKCGLNVNRDLNVAAAARGVPPHLPAAFVSAEGDPIVPCAHGQALSGAYAGSPKVHLRLEGQHHDHNSPRPKWTMNELVEFVSPFLFPS